MHSTENKNFKKEQMFEALLDPKTWFMFFFNVVINIPNGGLNSERKSTNQEDSANSVWQVSNL